MSQMKTFSLERPIHTVSSFVQTDPEHPGGDGSVKKSELHNLVKEIVLDTLKDAPYIGYNSNNTVTSCQKVDSGVQSEVENEVTEFEKNVSISFPSKGALLDDRNVTICQENPQVSKSIQVSLISVYDSEEKGNHSKSYNKENSYSSDTAKEDSIQSVIKKPKEDSSFSERNSHLQETSKLESMLEKIYQHVCQENKLSDSFLNSSVISPVLTREVAVQFNPLHTSNKSTITLEIKTADSSSQYDFPQSTESKQLSTAEVSVQATEIKEDLHYHQTDAFTQCEQKTFANFVVQTDLLPNYEYSAANTSVSSTPVSDNMFIDDLLSEGEISLPWNLRLLSLSDKSGSLSMNVADSSDISLKEKDYSLSEGEIHPNIAYIMNMPHCSQTEENDPHLDVYPSKLTATKCDSEKHFGQNLGYNKNIRLHISTSSFSEGELNSSTSLSLGEVLPDVRNSCSETHLQLGSCPSTSTPLDCDKMCCNLNSTYIQGNNIHPSMTNLNVVRNEEDEKNSNVETNFQSVPHNILPTVDEETHSIFD